jgi:acyl-CoA synthetase (AMP-forming)/AMP-acid ligase II
MIAGYFDDDGATRDTLRDGWFYSGDIGTVTEARVLTVTGRTGEFINSGGIKISPRVIEDVLLSLPEITQAVAFGVPDSDGMARIWAAVVADPPVDALVLQRLCDEKLGARSPKFILQFKELPRGANGKVLTSQLVAYGAAHYQRVASSA